MATRAMYPGTFDPITLGHEDLIRRAAKVFDTVVVAVAADTGSKAPMFSLDERVDMAREVIGDIAGVEVTGYQGLTIKYAEDHGLDVIIRGLRAVSDFEYEFQLASMNRQLTEAVETVFLTPTTEYTFISSSLVKEVATLGGSVNEFVSPVIEEALMRRVGRA